MKQNRSLKPSFQKQSAQPITSTDNISTRTSASTLGLSPFPLQRSTKHFPWDFPILEFLELLSTDAKNTLRYPLHVSWYAKYPYAHLPQHVSPTINHHKANVRPQFAAKLAAMKGLSEMAAQSRRQVEEKVWVVDQYGEESEGQY